MDISAKRPSTNSRRQTSLVIKDKNNSIPETKVPKINQKFKISVENLILRHQ